MKILIRKVKYLKIVKRYSLRNEIFLLFFPKELIFGFSFHKKKRLDWQLFDNNLSVLNIIDFTHQNFKCNYIVKSIIYISLFWK